MPLQLLRAYGTWKISTHFHAGQFWFRVGLAMDRLLEAGAVIFGIVAPVVFILVCSLWVWLQP